MPFLGLMGCKRFIQLSKRRLGGSKLTPATIYLPYRALVLGAVGRRPRSSRSLLALRAPQLVSAMAWLNGLPASVLLMWRRWALEGRLSSLLSVG
jgi:hypothetical protein